MTLEGAQNEFELKVASLVISPSTIILVLQYAMEAVELTTLSGAEKKHAVVQLVKKAVVDAPIDSGVESILLEMIDDGIIGHTIDIIVSASRGELNLNGVAKTSQIMCSNLAPLCVSSCFSMRRCKKRK